MRSRLRSLLQLVALVAIIDWAIGAGLSPLYERTKTGEGGGLVNHMLTQDADVLILGSSRARHHFVPSVLGEELSLRVYNAGADGQSFLFATMVFDLWQRRHSAPRAIVLNVDPDTFRATDEELQKTSVLSYYVDQSDHVREILMSRSEFERVKYLSRAYRFNGKVLPIAKNLLRRQDPSFDGYEGLSGIIDPAAGGEPARLPRGVLFTERTLRYFEALVEYCRRGATRLFLVHSPRFVHDEGYEAWVTELTSTLARYPGVELLAIDESTQPEAFAGRADRYADEGHLNDAGARVFSRLVAKELRRRLEKK